MSDGASVFGIRDVTTTESCLKNDAILEFLQDRGAIA
jgi:hypothetical protein